MIWSTTQRSAKRLAFKVRSRRRRRGIRKHPSGRHCAFAMHGVLECPPGSFGHIRPMLLSAGAEGAAVEDAKLMVQAAGARNGASLLPGLGELLQQLIAARAAGALPVQNGSSAAGHSLPLAVGHSLPSAYSASAMAAAAQGLAGPQVEAQRGGRTGKASTAAAAGGSRRGPPPTPPGTPDPSALQPEPELPCAAGTQTCGAPPQPLAADAQLCAAPPPPPPAAVQHPATVSSHSQPASQLHADAKVFTPCSAAAAAAAGVAVAEPAASAAQPYGHDGGFWLGQADWPVARETSSGPHSPPPSPCSPLAAVQPPSPASACQQGRHAAPSAAYASALVLQAAAAASQAQFSCGTGTGGGVGQLGSCAPDHPTSSPSCSGVPLKQGVHCSISSKCSWLAGPPWITLRGRDIPFDMPRMAANRLRLFM